MLERLILALALAVPAAAFAQAGKPAAPASTPPATKPAVEASAPEHPRVLLRTSMGDITVELFPDRAPKTVANFLQYVRDGFYDGTVFHRVIKGYLVQGGIFTRDLTQKRTRAPIASEADNGLSNLRGTIAAARGADPNSATAQFFINVVDNPRLDYVSNQSGLTWGFAVFGKVVAGMDVVDRIQDLPTAPQGPFAGDVPRPLVVIEKAELLPAPAAAASVAAPAAAKPAAGKKR
ncbi:peptidyl-prolyl cis-trans isomerase (rotamase) -cyclophilin family [Mizugakiibacter sediminis]|nr:peptidylprolyl isomerase [Mizugakiibacter sediminis]GAP65714.1 peptidyl-prolyl cis-trans isomerase (rotamase) -cyclophilin family [Mizugakiibacter sediminis]